MRVRVLVWNLAKGKEAKHPGWLEQVATIIRERNCDVVLLCEMKHERGWPFGNGRNMTVQLSHLCGLPHRHWGNTVRTGATGHAAVAVLSRYPLGPVAYHPVRLDGDRLDMGTLETSLWLGGRLTSVFSLRYEPVHWGDADFDFHLEQRRNRAGHEQALALVRALPPGRDVIVGGDFNAKPARPETAEHIALFRRESGLVDVFLDHPDPGFPADDQPDYVFVRGPYRVLDTERRALVPAPTDHPYLFAEMEEAASGFDILHGTTSKLLHRASNALLHSHDHRYTHAGSSGQQQVTAFASTDDNDWWLIKGPHGTPLDAVRGRPVADGDVVRLEHVATGRNLHSHSGHPSPVTGQQEVTCFLTGEDGDGNDDWRVEVDGGGVWTPGHRVRLVHVSTGHALHSHWGERARSIRDQQEVTCYAGRDDNDWWQVLETR